MLIRRLPFTSIVLVATLLVAALSGALWTGVQGQGWFSYLGYGATSYESGRWWTLFTGPLFAVVPAYYLPMAGSFALLAGLAEWRLGTRRAMAITVGAQLASVLGAEMFLVALRDVDWRWVNEISLVFDGGFSGGALAAGAALSATVRPPWQLRMRVFLCAYVGISIVYIGTFADLVHLIAVLPALLFAGKLAGKHRVSRSRKPSKREWRLLATTGLVLVTIAQVVVRLVPGIGPFGSEGEFLLPTVHVVVLGVVVVLIANGLRRGSRLAWWWAVGLTGISVLSGIILTGALGLAGVAGGTIGLPLFVADTAVWAAELAVLIAARSAFRVPTRPLWFARGNSPNGNDSNRARTLLRTHGGSTLSWMTTWPENAHFYTGDGKSYLAYRKHAGVAIALGDPIAPLGSGASAIREFTEMCDSNGLVPCVFSATVETTAITKNLGWQHVQVAEDTIVDLEGLQFRGKSWQDVRSAINRAGKEGIEYRLVRLADQPRQIVAQVRQISEAWIAEKGMPEMGFTLGGIDEAMDRDTRVGLAVDPAGTVHGVTSWMPAYTDSGEVEGWTLDVMRRRADGFRPVMEFLIASSCLAFKSEGARFVSLSGAPLARSSQHERAFGIENALESLGALMEPYYGFRSLHAFKAKFKPRYEPVYLAYRDEADLPRLGVALARAYLPDTGITDLIKGARRVKNSRSNGDVRDKRETFPAPVACSNR